MTLAGLQVCREVALLGSFTAAAHSLGYSQPTISRLVASTESAVGHRLFAREVRGVSTTRAGSVLVEHAARVLAGVEGLRRDLDGLGDRLGGRIAVGAFPAAMSVLIPRAVAHLRAEHPGLLVALVESSTPVLLRDLRAGKLEVAVIGIGAGLPEYDLDGLACHQVDAGGLCVAVSAGHRLAGAHQVDVSELVDEPWIAGTGPAGDSQFVAWPTLQDPIVEFRARSWPARLGLVAAGLGICLIPEMAAPSVPDGVVVVNVEDPAWFGRKALVVTASQPAEAALAVRSAVRSAADSVASVATHYRAIRASSGSSRGYGG